MIQLPPQREGLMRFMAEQRLDRIIYLRVKCLTKLTRGRPLDKPPGYGRCAQAYVHVFWKLDRGLATLLGVSLAWRIAV